MAHHNSLASRFYIDLLCTIVEGDFGFMYSVTRNLSRDIRTLRARYQQEGLGFLTKALPAYGRAVDTALADDSAFVRPRGFPGVDQRPNLFGELYDRVFSRDGRLLAEPDVRAVFALRQLTFIFYKLKLNPSNEQIDRTINSFVETDQNLPDLGDFDRPNDRLLRTARLIIGRVVCNIDPKEIIPRHGPGSVATRESKAQKPLISTSYDSCERLYPILEYGRFSLGHVCDDPEYDVEAESFSRLTHVPKDSRGPRLISMEPLYIQWLQQGLKDRLYDLVESHPLTRGRCQFRDQSLNQEAARRASISCDAVTLDMKEASDRVSLELVRALFSHTALYDGLMATRSAGTELPDGSLVRFKKFAPMGSALCFPVEALCFFSLTVAALHLGGFGSLYKCCRSVYVYGDDLIVPSDYWHLVVAALERYSLKVNIHKSCVGTSGFRESCGTDWLRGFLVTPVRIKRPITDRPWDYIPSLVGSSNTFYERGLYSAASFIETFVSKWAAVPYSPRPLGALCYLRDYVKAPSSRRRYNSALQCMEYRAWIGRPKATRLQGTGWQLLLYHNYGIGKSSSPVQTSKVDNRFTVSYRKAWCQLS